MFDHEKPFSIGAILLTAYVKLDGVGEEVARMTRYWIGSDWGSPLGSEVRLTFDFASPVVRVGHQPESSAPTRSDHNGIRLDSVFADNRDTASSLLI